MSSGKGLSWCDSPFLYICFITCKIIVLLFDYISFMIYICIRQLEVILLTLKLKDMKTATKKIVLTKKGLANKQVLSMIENCRFDEKSRKIYTGYYSGSKRFTTRHSAMHTITSILDAQGYKYEIGNDSERNGASGEFVKVSKVAFGFINQLKE